MILSDYFPILIQIILAATLAIVILGASALLGQRSKKDAIKETPYECGVPPTGGPRVQFSIKFYMTAMLFILFDVEIVFLIPWVLAFRDFLGASIPVLLPALFFIFLIALGLFYEIRKGALEWER